MKAINLIPVDERRGAGGAAGRSGGAAFVLLGALTVLVVLVGFYASAGKTINDRKAEASRLERDAATMEARAAALQPYTLFNRLRVSRTQTIRSLAASRFDWSHALGELARVIPDDVQLETLRGSVSAGSSTGGRAGGGNSLRGAIPGPALEMTGCAPSHVRVARMIVRMRLMDGVKRVSLQDSIKAAPQKAANGSTPSAAAGGCASQAQFNLVVFLEPIAPAGTPATPSVQQPTAAVTPPATSGATP